MKTMIAILLSVGAVICLAEESLSYKSDQGVEFVVSSAGLSSVRFNGREMAAGKWEMFNAAGWFKEHKDTRPQAGWGKIVERTIRVVDPKTAVVKHNGGDLSVTFTYSFSGEDVLISARVENSNADAAVPVCGFGGLMFTFDELPRGLMPVQHASYFQAHGIGLCHPGHWMKIGGTWAADSSIGVGTSPLNTGMSRTLTLWDYADWGQNGREKSPKRRLMYFAVQEVPPRGAATVDFVLRISPRREWEHLLSPYRAHFVKTFGEVQYKADPRWIATEYMNHSQKAVSKENPYGLHGQHRRIDTADGAARFADTVIPLLKDHGGQGIIVWGQGGDDPRGGMYRPDFDVLPPEVEAQWGGIARRFSEAGLKLGVCTRPGEMAVKRDWKSDQIIRMNPGDPGHVEMLWRRFDTMIKHGCTLFYLDSFGASFDDVKLMKKLRQRMGPEILTFCEHQCDAILPLSGGYSEISLNAEGKFRLWSGTENWEVYRWLVPGSQMAGRLYEIKGKLEDGAAEAWMRQNGVLELLPLSDKRRAQWIGAR